MVDYRFPVEDPQFAPEKFVGIWNTGPERATGVLVGDHYFLSAGHIEPGGVFIPASSPSEPAPFGGAGVDLTGPNYRVYIGPGLQDIQLVRLNQNTDIPVSEIPGLVLFVNPQDAVGKTRIVRRVSWRAGRRQPDVFDQWIDYIGKCFWSGVFVRHYDGQCRTKRQPYIL